MKKYFLVSLIMISSLSVNLYASWWSPPGAPSFDNPFPSPQDVIDDIAGDIESLMDGDVCSVVPGCTDLEFHVKSCFIEQNEPACLTSIAIPDYLTQCQAVADVATSIFDVTKGQDLGDVINSKSLYGDVEHIFEDLLDSPGFENYVRRNVNHYLSDLVQSGGKTAGNNIYYRSTSPSDVLIIHELVHVWQQYIRNSSEEHVVEYCSELAEDLQAAADNGFNTQYEFTLDASKSFLEYGQEQQAEMVENYYRIFFSTAPFNGSICDAGVDDRYFLNCEDYTGSSAYADLKADFESVFAQASGTAFVSTTELSNGTGQTLWTNSGSYDWLRSDSTTPSSSTGPSDTNDASFYSFLETSSGNAYNAGNTAELVSEPIINASNLYLNFSYHMYGSDMGELKIQQETSSGFVTIWSKSGEQQLSSSSAWKDVSIKPVYSGNTRFKIVGTAAGGYKGDMAITNVSFTLFKEMVCSASKLMDYDHPIGRLAHQNQTHCTYVVFGSNLEDDAQEGCTNGWRQTWGNWNNYECQITIDR